MTESHGSLHAQKKKIYSMKAWNNLSEVSLSETAPWVAARLMLWTVHETGRERGPSPFPLSSRLTALSGGNALSPQGGMKA